MLGGLIRLCQNTFRTISTGEKYFASLPGMRAISIAKVLNSLNRESSQQSLHINE